MKNFRNQFINEVLDVISAYDYEYEETVNATHNFRIIDTRYYPNCVPCYMVLAADIIKIAVEYDCKHFSHDGKIFTIECEDEIFTFTMTDGWNM